MSSIPRLQIERARVAIADLEHWPGNSRRGDVKLIGELLDEHGQYRPLVVQASTRRVIAGNHTLMALRDAGELEVDVDLVDVDDDRAEKINVADNRAQDR